MDIGQMLMLPHIITHSHARTGAHAKVHTGARAKCTGEKSLPKSGRTKRKKRGVRIRATK